MRTLERSLGIPAAAAIGVASMLGAGVLVVWASATAAAGAGVLVALPLAALIAALNATSTIRLAMRHPRAGGVYASGRAELGPVWGFAAGVLFLVGKTASVAAIGLVAGAYLWPGGERIVAAALVVALAAINATGIRSTALVSGIAAAIVITGLIVVLGAALVRGPADPSPEVLWPSAGPDAVLGVLQATGLIFFAFAGYARIATLGEEVRDPVRTLPRAALVSVAGVLLLGAGVLVTLLVLLGTRRLAVSAAPVAEAAGPAWAPVVAGIAAVACAGSLTGVLAGLSRTALAMGRDRELPGVLARIGAQRATPVVADVLVAVVALVAVLLLDPARVIGVSACAVLGYYAIAHVAALRAGAAAGVPRSVAIAGLAGCVVVTLATPWPALVGVAGALALALLVRAVVRRSRRLRPPRRLAGDDRPA